MNTALAIQNDKIMAGTADEQSLILPNKREVLLTKLNKFKVHNRSAREQVDYDHLTWKLSAMFVHLCWSKLGISKEQLRQLEQQDLNVLAAMVFGQSRIRALVSTGILMCIPLLGWLMLRDMLVAYSSYPSFADTQYYWWYRKMKNRFGQDFEPSLGSPLKRKS